MAARTAILHLLDPARAASAGPPLDRLAGVARTVISGQDGVLAVQFDQRLTSVADIIRCLEETGTIVLGVALRQGESRK